MPSGSVRTMPMLGSDRRRYFAALLVALMVLPTVLGWVRSTRAEGNVLELGWDGVVRQSHPFLCGPAVIATLLARRGVAASDVEIAVGAEVRSGGLSLAEFARLAAEHALPGRWFDASGGTRVSSLPHPIVVHLESPAGHYAIVERTLEGFVQLADPARGRILVPEDRFAREWSGRVFLFDLTAGSRET